MTKSIWDDKDFMQRRQQARDRLDDLVSQSGNASDRQSWFEQVYDLANGDAAAVPWADLQPKGALVRWLESKDDAPRNAKAIDVACGLGDNARALTTAGYDVTAFDLSANAIAWANKRFGNSGIGFVTADLFDLPAEWMQAFALVHETYTIQALQGDMRAASFGQIAALVAPQGRLVVICRARDDDEAPAGPPWPLSRTELLQFENHGLELVQLEDFVETRDRPIRHFLAEFVRA